MKKLLIHKRNVTLSLSKGILFILTILLLIGGITAQGRIDRYDSIAAADMAKDDILGPYVDVSVSGTKSRKITMRQLKKFLAADSMKIVGDSLRIYTENDSIAVDVSSLGGSSLTEEEVEDFVGGMLGGTETLITVTYQDGTGDIDFVVDNDLANYDNSTSNFSTGSHLSTSGIAGTVNVSDGSNGLQSTNLSIEDNGSNVAISAGAGTLQFTGMNLSPSLATFTTPVRLGTVLGDDTPTVVQVSSSGDVSVLDFDADEMVVVPTGNLAASDVQAALEELQTDIDGISGTDDQTASEVAFTPHSSVSATDVQSAIEEILDEGLASQVSGDITSTIVNEGSSTTIKTEEVSPERYTEIVVGRASTTINASESGSVTATFNVTPTSVLLSTNTDSRRFLINSTSYRLISDIPIDIENDLDANDNTISNANFIPRSAAITSSSNTTTPDADYLWNTITLTENTTFNAPTGGVDLQSFAIRIYATAVYTLAWNGIYATQDNTLPTSTVANKTIKVYFQKNDVTSTFDFDGFKIQD